jgi:hypothetical protein
VAGDEEESRVPPRRAVARDAGHRRARVSIRGVNADSAESPGVDRVPAVFEEEPAGEALGLERRHPSAFSKLSRSPAFVFVRNATASELPERLMAFRTGIGSQRAP